MLGDGPRCIRIAAPRDEPSLRAAAATRPSRCPARPHRAALPEDAARRRPAGACGTLGTGSTCWPSPTPEDRTSTCWSSRSGQPRAPTSLDAGRPAPSGRPVFGVRVVDAALGDPRRPRAGDPRRPGRSSKPRRDRRGRRRDRRSGQPHRRRTLRAARGRSMFRRARSAYRYAFLATRLVWRIVRASGSGLTVQDIGRRIVEWATLDDSAHRDRVAFHHGRLDRRNDATRR